MLLALAAGQSPRPNQGQFGCRLAVPQDRCSASIAQRLGGSAASLLKNVDAAVLPFLRVLSVLWWCLLLGRSAESRVLPYH